MLHAKSLGRASALAILAVFLSASISVSAASAQEEEAVRVIPIEATAPQMSGPEIAGPAVDGPSLSEPAPPGAEIVEAGPEIEPALPHSSAADETIAEPFAPLPADPLMEAAAQSNAPDGVSETSETPGETVNAGARRSSNAGEVEVAAVDPAAGAETNIYDQWVQEKFSSQPKMKEHPYARRHPDHFVVVCEAGCAEEQAHVVYLERRDARGPVNETPISKGTVAGTASIDCVGGCYDHREHYAAVRPYEAGPAMSTSSDSSEDGWLSTEKPDGASSEGRSDAKSTSSDGRWYERIN